MKAYYKIYYFIFLSAIVLYIVGLFLPYRTIQCFLAVDQIQTGTESVTALSGLILIVPLIALAFIKNSHLVNWLSIGLSILLFFLPILLLFWFPTGLLAGCEEKEEIGSKLLSFSSVLFFLVAIIKRRIPVDTTAVIKNDTSTDTIDNF